MSTLRVSNIEAKSDASSPSVNEKVKVTNSNGDVLVHVNGETSGITTIGINTTGESVSFDSNQNATFVGIVTATTFSGNLIGNVTGGISTSQINVGDTFLKPQSVGVGITNAAGRDAGISTATGTVIYDPDIGMQIYTGDAMGWRTIADTESIRYMQATGGSVSNYVDGSTRYAVHTFNSTQTFEITQLAIGPAPNSVDYLVVAGGGGGGSRHGGGGGAGGMLTGSYTVSALETRTMTVGGGGNGAPAAGDSSGTDGVGSSISGGIASAVGGGYGTSYAGPGGPGGSGGGSRGNGPSTVPGGSGTPGQGNAGGSGDTNPSSYSLGGGGGGAGGTGYPGGPSGSNLGQGGDGSSSTITGSSVTYAGGGGAGGNNAFASGGSGGGGNAGPSGTTGSVNTGGGGGAGGHSGPTNYAGFGGGSGVIIVRYVTDPA